MGAIVGWVEGYKLSHRSLARACQNVYGAVPRPLLRRIRAQRYVPHVHAHTHGGGGGVLNLIFPLVWIFGLTQHDPEEILDHSMEHERWKA